MLSYIGRARLECRANVGSKRSLGGCGQAERNFQATRARLIQYECRYENFNARGDDDYLIEFARNLEVLLRAGWTPSDFERDPVFRGWWRISFVKERVSGAGNPGAE